MLTTLQGYVYKAGDKQPWVLWLWQQVLCVCHAAMCDMIPVLVRRPTSTFAWKSPSPANTQRQGAQSATSY